MIKNKIFKLLKIFILLILSICFVLHCKSLEVKPKPAVGEWKKCHICNGYGKIETYDISGLNQDSEDETDKELGSCLFGFFLSGTKSGKQYTEQLEQEKKDGVRDNTYNVKRPAKKKWVKCNYCNGLGWIEVTD